MKLNAWNKLPETSNKKSIQGSCNYQVNSFHLFLENIALSNFIFVF